MSNNKGKYSMSKINADPHFLTAPASILSAVKALITPEKAVDIAVAFWGKGAVKELGLTRAAPGSRILLNSDSGACNPTELRELMKIKHITVKNAPKLHAKVIIGEGSVLVGSANASSNGLGFQGAELLGWNEACVQFDSPQMAGKAGAWFESLWSAQKKLSEADVVRAEAAWIRLRQTTAKQPAKNGGPISIESMAGLDIFVVLNDEESTFDQVELDSRLTDAGLDPANIDCFQDWKKMPKGALLICFGAEQGESSCSFDDTWVSPPDGLSIKLSDGDRAYPVFRASAIECRRRGMPSNRLHWKKPVDDFIKLARRVGIKSLLSQCPRAQHQGPTDWCIPLDDFLRLCHEHKLAMPKGFVAAGA